ncbi:ARM repeat-containing protein [Meira miltonrushii]|uniref:ARM repeat-containing protein n=1 Tax=Meira miltonrushii TaxID=1280837 RepID=A0A316V8K3_9BASI|nr:ARM repeat-containing protein [Meira miltonrushii]PWN32811.1 ARM repeat-containing protein [Meira miltonrushii]
MAAPMVIDDSTSDQQNPSPTELAFELNPYLHSIERVAADHGLQHDSGVSFGGSTSKSPKPVESTAGTGSNEQPRTSRFLMTPAGSSASLKRPSVSSAEGSHSRVKRMIESPTLTGEFDAQEDIWADVSRRLKPFGDILRHERLRTDLGNTSLAEDCVGLLTESTRRYKSDSIALSEAQVEMMRILANLCIDHDENREKLLTKGAPQGISVLLQTILSLDDQSFRSGITTVLRTAAGALLNLQLDHASTQAALRADERSIGMLLKLATDVRVYELGDWYRPPRNKNENTEDWKKHVSTGSSVSTWAWRIIQDVCSGDEEEGNAKSENMEKTSSSDEGEKPIESLVTIDQPAKVANLLIHPLQRLLPPSSSDMTFQGNWDADDVSDMMESDMDIVQIATELIESCSLDSKPFRVSALEKVDFEGQQSTILEFLVHFADSAQSPDAWSFDREESNNLPPKPSDEEAAKEVITKFSRAKAAISRAIVCIVGEDENMTKLFEGQGSGQGGWFTEKMKEWMERDAKDRDDLVSTAMLAVGNLARKDAHCIALVHEHHIVPTLTRLLDPSADIKVAHGTMCLLKNLAIPSQNKRIIGASNDLISRLGAFLDKSRDNVQPLQFATVGLLKHLCSANVDNSFDFVLGGTLPALLDLIRRTDDVPTRMEGTRVLVNAVKSLWSSALTPAANSSNQTVDPNARQRARHVLTCEPVVSALSEMVKNSTKYPVLVNEGILALTLIAASIDDQLSSGAQMVARALQTISSPRRKSSAAPVGGNNESSTTNESNEQLPRLPQRQTTLDALASAAPNALPVLRSGADMIATVLARRDARMPPQFANNACALVQALVAPHQSTTADETVSAPETSDPVQTTPNTNEGVDAISNLLQSLRPALEQLSTVGPQESLPIAQKALDSVRAFLK